MVRLKAGFVLNIFRNASMSRFWPVLRERKNECEAGPEDPRPGLIFLSFRQRVLPSGLCEVSQLCVRMVEEEGSTNGESLGISIMYRRNLQTAMLIN